ncbi:tyrosine-type recombinase/integrase [Thiothrix nivea]|uniref:Integrase family protein n=1 Tax=Thiothrix nivea (strain ATCC 35100 / DSM 5205 / JP2) TaxID=870187 RepID=A0A656HB21_THINJ|nr:site-specific integrase [Thiothrix nivea]EIJ33547.1 integrase family protein [Thiothrix nivea DSM 5205]
MANTFTNHKGIKAASTDKAQTMFKDTECKGLYLRVYPTGRKAFIHRYWLKGKERLYTLGLPELTAKSTEREIAGALSKARALVAEQKAQAQDGIDPAIERNLKAHKVATMPTIEQFADTYINLYAKARKKSWETDRRYLARDVVPILGSLPLDKVGRGHVVALLDKKQEAGAMVARNRLISLLSKFFNYAIERGHITANPAAGIKRTKETSVERTLNDAEIRFLWEQTGDKTQLEPSTALAIRMVLITGQRPGEVAAMHESQLQGDVWRMEDTKNGLAHSVPLSPMALEIIGQARPHARNGVLFPNLKGEVMAGTIMPRAMKRMDWPDKPATPHDLRRTCLTGLGAMGFNRLVQDKVANHKDRTIGGVYDRYDYMAEKRQALEAWGRKLDAILNGHTGGNVVPFKIAG